MKSLFSTAACVVLASTALASTPPASSKAACQTHAVATILGRYGVTGANQQGLATLLVTDAAAYAGQTTISVTLHRTLTEVEAAFDLPVADLEAAMATPACQGLN